MRKQYPVSLMSRECLVPWAKQPRKHFDADKLRELADSLRAVGQLQPLLVRPLAQCAGAVTHEIIVGERRWQAAGLAGLDQMKVEVVEMGDDEALELSIVENVQRADLNVMEEADGYAALSASGWCVEDIAERFGRSVDMIYELLTLTKLDPLSRAALQDGKIARKVGEQLSRIKSLGERETALDLIVRVGGKGIPLPREKALWLIKNKIYLLREYVAIHVVDGTMSVEEGFEFEKKHGEKGGPRVSLYLSDCLQAGKKFTDQGYRRYDQKTSDQAAEVKKMGERFAAWEGARGALKLRYPGSRILTPTDHKWFFNHKEKYSEAEALVADDMLVPTEQGKGWTWEKVAERHGELCALVPGLAGEPVKVFLREALIDLEKARHEGEPEKCLFQSTERGKARARVEYRKELMRNLWNRLGGEKEAWNGKLMADRTIRLLEWTLKNACFGSVEIIASDLGVDIDTLGDEAQSGGVKWAIGLAETAGPVGVMALALLQCVRSVSEWDEHFDESMAELSLILGEAR